MSENEKKILILMLLLRITKLGADCKMEEYVREEIDLDNTSFDEAKSSLVSAGLIHHQCGHNDTCCPISFTIKGAQKARSLLVDLLFLKN